jgi:hypothetical protein
MPINTWHSLERKIMKLIRSQSAIARGTSQANLFGTCSSRLRRPSSRPASNRLKVSATGNQRIELLLSQAHCLAQALPAIVDALPPHWPPNAAKHPLPLCDPATVVRHCLAAYSHQPPDAAQPMNYHPPESSPGVHETSGRWISYDFSPPEMFRRLPDH